MSENPQEQAPPSREVGNPEDPPAPQREKRQSHRGSGRQRKGGRSRSAYTFPDDLERSICRNAQRTPPSDFPVINREGVARPAMVELARTESQVLFCDLLHDGPHMWPNGDEFTGP